jgi:hypothetical protein
MEVLGYGSDSQIVRTGVTVLPGGNVGIGTGVTILSSGYVGIGTSNPNATLDVRATKMNLDLTTAENFYSNIVVAVNQGPSPGVFGGYIQGGVHYGQSHYMAFGYVNPVGITNTIQSYNEVMRIKSNGNVGIGTTNPGAPLHVSKSSNYPEVYIEYTGINRVTLGCGAGGAFLGYSGYLVIGTMTGPQVTGFTEYMRITSDGKLGIGGTPSYQLDLSTDGARKLTTSTWLTGSDARLKSNIQLADTARCYDIIKTVPLKRYTWRSDMDIYDSVKDRSKLGWIAQDVEAVFPKAVDRNPVVYNQKYEEVVKEDGSVEKKLVSQEVIEDCLTLNADQIYAVMYGAVQKLIESKEEQAAEISELRSGLAELHSGLAQKSAQLDALLAWASEKGFSQ